MFEIFLKRTIKQIRKKILSKDGQGESSHGLIIRVEGLEAFIGEVCEIQIKSTRDHCLE